MITLIKSIIWIVGTLVIAYYALGIFGYQVNKQYFSYSKQQCEKKFKDCGTKIIARNKNLSDCSFRCLDPKLIIKKK